MSPKLAWSLIQLYGLREASGSFDEAMFGIEST
jgi:hypothetical protein